MNEKRLQKTRLDQLSQTHGKIENYEPSTLDQIIGETGLAKYSTLDRDEYLNYLNNFNKTDLHRHSISLGQIPIDNRERLTKKLLSEFDLWVSSYKKPKASNKESPKITDEVLRILATGR